MCLWSHHPWTWNLFSMKVTLKYFTFSQSNQFHLTFHMHTYYSFFFFLSSMPEVNALSCRSFFSSSLSFASMAKWTMLCSVRGREEKKREKELRRQLCHRVLLMSNVLSWMCFTFIVLHSHEIRCGGKKGEKKTAQVKKSWKLHKVTWNI